MKKIITLMIVMMFTIMTHAEVTYGGYQFSANLTSIRTVVSAAPAALAKSYIGNGYSYNDSTKTWEVMTPWTITSDTVIYGTIVYDALYDVVPSMFTNSVDYDYIFKNDSLLMFYCDPLYKLNDSLYIFSMDYTAFKNSGYGNIVLVLESDGSLHIPVEYKNHVYGFFICTMDTSTYSPVTVYGAFAQYAGLTYTINTTSLNEVNNMQNTNIKRFEKGQIILYKNGHKYSVIGQPIR